MNITVNELQKGIEESYEVPNNVIQKIPNPLVTIRVSTYQHSRFIEQCLNGILSQRTDFDFEIIIGEDFSTDGTREIVFKYASMYRDKIRLITADKNMGAKINGTRCVYSSRGKYAAICEGDDYWSDPLKLQKQVLFLESHPEYCGCFTNYGIVDESGKIVKNAALNYEEKDLTHTDILISATPKTLTTMVRSELMPKTYPKEFVNVKNGDLVASAIASQYGPYRYFNYVTGYYRAHSGGIWSQLNQLQKNNDLIYTAKQLLKYFKNKNQKKAIYLRIEKRRKKSYQYFKREKQYVRMFFEAILIVYAKLVQKII